MIIQLMSDLHFEFHDDGGTKFVDNMNPTDVDVLVLAGDICEFRAGLISALEEICYVYDPADVVYVPGNHEFYGTTNNCVKEGLRNLEERVPNFHFLYGNHVTLLGQRFIGGTLWFRDHPENVFYHHALSDFTAIPDFLEFITKDNQEHVDYLGAEMRSDDIVVTHHLPSGLSVGERFREPSPYAKLNRFFVCEMELFIQARRPKLWLHGHTHSSCDYEIPHGDTGTATRVICNPSGYENVLINADFDPRLLIAVTDSKLTVLGK